MSLEVTVICDESCFDLPEWAELLERDPHRSVFATPQWNRVWWEEFGADKELFILVLKRGQDIAGLVPLYRKDEGGRAVLRFVGGIELTDYLGPICSLADRDDVAAGIVSWLSSRAIEWDEFDAHSMPVPFGFAEFLVDHADRAGFEISAEQEETSALLTLPATWDEYLTSLASKDRHELRRKQRKLVRDYPDASFRTSTPETLEVDLKTFVEMHRGTEGDKGHFMNPEVATFFERVARAFMPLGWLRLDFLEIAGTPVASTFGFELDGIFYLYNSAFEPDAARLSPGLMLVAELVRDSIERGFEMFDLLRGPERYKYQLGAEPVPLNNVRVFNGRSA